MVPYWANNASGPTKENVWSSASSAIFLTKSFVYTQFETLAITYILISKTLYIHNSPAVYIVGTFIFVVLHQGVYTDNISNTLQSTMHSDNTLHVSETVCCLLQKIPRIHNSKGRRMSVEQFAFVRILDPFFLLWSNTWLDEKKTIYKSSKYKPSKTL